MNGFDVSVVDFLAKRLAGIKVRTSLAQAQHDCPALWQNFCRHVPAGYRKGVYGISVMLNAQDFDYWAAFETADGPLPAELAPVEIPAGAYARCQVPNLESIGAGYMFLYQTWLAGQREWKLNEQASCFELYQADWTPASPFELYMPVKR